MAESDLIVARRAMEGLDDLLFVLSCAIEDVEDDLALDRSPGTGLRGASIGCSRPPVPCLGRANDYEEEADPALAAWARP